jgi:hypothetical protein
MFDRSSYGRQKSIAAFGRRRSFLKIKHLRLVTPERANKLGIPAEAPTFCSPYIHEGFCHLCDVHYTPLIYQIGQTTEAQHFCVQGGGGIYVQLPEDSSRRWLYNDGLFTATVLPSGPIRMGNDRGYQFRSVTPKRIELARCTHCGALCDSGNLEYKSIYGDVHSYELAATCGDQRLCTSPPHQSEWKFAINADGTMSFSSTKRLTLPDNAGVLRRG